jgi:hypothetical protein
MIFDKRDMTFTRGTINISLKERIEHAAISSGFCSSRRAEDIEDFELLRYSASARKGEWISFRIDNGGFYGKKGRERKNSGTGMVHF